MPGRTTMHSHAMNQTAVYWGSPSPVGDGSYSFDDAVELSVRWEQGQEEIADDEGRTHVSNARVFVGQDVDVGGYLYLGSLADLSSSEEGDPFLIADARRIVRFDKAPSLDATHYTRSAWL